MSAQLLMLGSTGDDQKLHQREGSSSAQKLLNKFDLSEVNLFCCMA